MFVTHLYTRVLGTEIDCLMVGRVGDAKDVTNIVGRPQRIETKVGGGTPDLDERGQCAI